MAALVSDVMQKLEAPSWWLCVHLVKEAFYGVMSM